jgi:glycosyltransferase involved in cell wall biosynthesis
VLTPEAAVAVVPNDHDALVEAVCEVVEDEERREVRGEAARALAVESYAWPTIARRLERVYASVTGIEVGEARAA